MRKIQRKFYADQYHLCASILFNFMSNVSIDSIWGQAPSVWDLLTTSQLLNMTHTPDVTLCYVLIYVSRLKIPLFTPYHNPQGGQIPERVDFRM